MVLASAVLMLILLGIVVLAARSGVRRQRQRDLVLSQRWAQIQSQAHTMPDAGLAQVANVYQPARRGSKAEIVWLATGYRQDTWFAYNWPRAGSIVLLRGSTGWGPHNQNPNVFYVAPNQILSLLPPDTMAAVRRQQQRDAQGVGR
ncbi:hypothetical protein GCM10010174_44510 [Kutzneria viridogrisea]|uniref:hypothetical protein n=1 Tax=Kutzneria viridogrisea TaxID=47990 RepID=UPI0031F9536B